MNYFDVQILAYPPIEIYEHHRLDSPGWDVVVHKRKCKVISLVVDADMEGCVAISVTDFRVEITHFLI